jgi:hypothetical protein
MTGSFPKEETRQALTDALPAIDEASSVPSAQVAFTYVPPSHARALDPEHTLVEGIRGAGKSFWWAALNSEPHRLYVASAFPETRIDRNVETSQAFGSQLQNISAPSKDTLAQLTASFEPRHVWRAIIATHIGFPSPFPSGKWHDKVHWVTEHPEEFDELLYGADERLKNSGKVHLILFDALDRLADDWNHIRPLARSLFQVALDLRACQAIRTKLFVRPDMIEDREILNFPDSSKLLARKVPLTWQRADLYALLFQCLGNAPAPGGNSFRAHCLKIFDLRWDQDPASNAWIVPKSLRFEEDRQKAVFHAITGPTMAGGPSGHKRGFPYTWLPNHLLDGRDQVSPRSFCAALRHAVMVSIPDDWLYPLHFKAIQTGVKEASRIRVDEITREDYPWVQQIMEPLFGQITVPCEPEKFISIWAQKKTIGNLIGQGDSVKLPPQHLEEGPEGILKDLEGLGLIQRLRDGRVQMPDVYRIAFGLGRKGGVKPLK